MNRGEKSADEQGYTIQSHPVKPQTKAWCPPFRYRGIEQPTKKHPFLKRSLHKVAAHLLPIPARTRIELIQNEHWASLGLKSVQFLFHFGHFRPPWSSQKLSGRPPKACLDTNRRPKPSPERNPSFSYGKTANLEDQNCYVGAPNKPQPPPPVELFFDSASYTSSVKGPTRRAPGSADSEGLRPHAPTLEEGSQPNVSFAPNSKREPGSKIQIQDPSSKLQPPKAKLAAKNSNRRLAPPP